MYERIFKKGNHFTCDLQIIYVCLTYKIVTKDRFEGVIFCKMRLVSLEKSIRD